nr:hypothetical protein [Archaeoglobus fulgidus]
MHEHDSHGEAAHSKSEDMQMIHQHHEHHGHEEEHSAHHERMKHPADHGDHHRMMMEDFKKRFYVSTLLTIPILILSPAIQTFLGFRVEFAGSLYILFLLSSAVYFYGG